MNSKIFPAMEVGKFLETTYLKGGDKCLYHLSTRIHDTNSFSRACSQCISFYNISICVYIYIYTYVQGVYIDISYMYIYIYIYAK